MAAIMPSLWKLAENMGLNIKKDTIEEQINAMNKALEQKQENNIANALWNYADASGGGGGFNTVMAAYPWYDTNSDKTVLSPFEVFTSNDGVYDLSGFSYASSYGRAYLGNPATRVEFGSDNYTVVFTPSDSFDITTAFKCSDDDNYSTISSGSATPQPGDGKAYYAVCSGWNNTVSVSAIAYVNSGDTDFVFDVE